MTERGSRGSSIGAATGVTTPASASSCWWASRSIAGVIWYRIGIGGASAGESGAAPAAVSTTAPSTTLVDPTPTGAAATATGAKGQAATIVVHVAGAVNHPGVVELQPARGSSTRSRPSAVRSPTVTSTA